MPTDIGPQNPELDSAARDASAVAHAAIRGEALAAGEPKESFCKLFHIMRRADRSVEGALIYAKRLVADQGKSIVLNEYDSERATWLHEQLVKWVVECFYEPIGAPGGSR